MGSLSSKHVLKALVWLQYLRKKIQLARGRNHQQLFPSFSLKPETPTAPFMPPVYPSACAHTRMQQDKLGTRSKVRGYCRTVTQRSKILFLGLPVCVFVCLCPLRLPLSFSIRVCSSWSSSSHSSVCHGTIKCLQDSRMSLLFMSVFVTSFCLCVFWCQDFNTHSGGPFNQDLDPSSTAGRLQGDLHDS